MISVSDLKNKTLFKPTDKIILYNYKGKHYITGAFCGFDFTNLSKGVLINNKMYCPTCCTGYNIENGMVDEGPSMRNLSTFPNQIRKGVLQAILPGSIPPFNARA